MGFSTCLQGRTAHEALLQRQDAELRLLETMRRCLMNKVKCDREYAIALSSVANQGLKIDRSEELIGSLVTSAWRSTMEEVDNIGKLIRQNADAMETRAIDRLAAMCTEKRRARKQYQEEHNRISQQFSHVSIFTYMLVTGMVLVIDQSTTYIRYTDTGHVLNTWGQFLKHTMHVLLIVVN